MSRFLRHSERRIPKKEVKDLQVFTASSLMHRFQNDIEILECEEAADRIREHKDCLFAQFAFWGECEIEREWYYMAANGSLFSSTTQIILLRKETCPR